MKLIKVIIALVLFLLFVSSFFLDKLIFNFAEKLHNNSFTRVVFEGILYLMDGYIHIILITIVMAVFFLLTKQSIQRIVTFLIGIFVSGFTALILKLIIQRARPTDNLFFASWDTSFPSFHAMVAFMTLPFIIQYKNYYLTVLWAVIMVILAFARVYSKVHYFSDLMGGMILGFLIGKLVILVEKRYFGKIYVITDK